MDQYKFERKGRGGLQVCLYSRIIVFPFCMEKCRLYEDKVRFPRGLISNDADGEMAI